MAWHQYRVPAWRADRPVDTRPADFTDYMGGRAQSGETLVPDRVYQQLLANLVRLKRKLTWAVRAALIHHRAGRSVQRDIFFRIASRLRRGISRLKVAVRNRFRLYGGFAPRRPVVLQDAVAWSLANRE